MNWKMAIYLFPRKGKFATASTRLKMKNRKSEDMLHFLPNLGKERSSMSLKNIE